MAMPETTKNIDVIIHKDLAVLDDELNALTAKASETMKTMLARNQENKGVAEKLELMSKFRENVNFDSPKATTRLGK
jgi:hypothetical protein